MKIKLSKWLFALFIILLPWQTRWIFWDYTLADKIWEYGRLSVYISWLVLLASALLFWLQAGFKIKWTRDWLFYCILVFGLVNCFANGASIVSIYYFVLILSAVLFAYLWRQFPKIYLLRIFLLGGLLQSAVAIAQFWSQKVIANKWLGLASHAPEVPGDSAVVFGDLRILRAYGSLTHPNVLGGFLLVVIFFGIYLWVYFYKKQSNQKWLELIFIMVTMLASTYALLASFSRSAVLALAVSLFCAMLINIFKKDWLTFKVILKYIIIFAIVFVSFNLLYSGAWAARLGAQGALEQKSLTERVDGLKQFSFDNPKNILLGQGLGLNTLVMHEAHPDQPIYNNQPIHNIFILYLAETGLVGVIILVFVLRRVFRSSFKPDILSTSLLLGLVIIGLFDHYLWTSWTGLLLGSLGIVSLYKE